MGVKRSRDVEEVLATVGQYWKDLDFDPAEWLANDLHVALINGNDDVVLLERLRPKVVIGHYFFHSRGRLAVDVGKEMLHEIFTGPYDVEVVEGLTPLHKLGARWMNKQLHFKSYGVVQTSTGPHEVVILTKEEWRLLNG
jgi:hypothetical protein